MTHDNVGCWRLEYWCEHNSHPRVSGLAPGDDFLISQAHRDHYGLLVEAPGGWPIYCGAARKSSAFRSLSCNTHDPREDLLDAVQNSGSRG